MQDKTYFFEQFGRNRGVSRRLLRWWEAEETQSGFSLAAWSEKTTYWWMKSFYVTIMERCGFLSQQIDWKDTKVNKLWKPEWFWTTMTLIDTTNSLKRGSIVLRYILALFAFSIKWKSPYSKLNREQEKMYARTVSSAASSLLATDLFPPLCRRIFRLIFL